MSLRSLVIWKEAFIKIVNSIKYGFFQELLNRWSVKGSLISKSRITSHKKAFFPTFVRNLTFKCRKSVQVDSSCVCVSVCVCLC